MSLIKRNLSWVLMVVLCGTIASVLFVKCLENKPSSTNGPGQGQQSTRILSRTGVSGAQLKATAGSPHFKQGPSMRAGASEMLGMRTETSKMYDNGDGTRTLVISPGALHYRNPQTGLFEEIATGLTTQRELPLASRLLLLRKAPMTVLEQEVYDYSNESNSLRAYFKANSGVGNLQRVDLGDKDFVIWQPGSISWVNEKGEVQPLGEMKDVPGVVDGNAVSYQGIFENVNETFMVLPGKVKDQIELIAAPAAPSITGMDINLVIQGTLVLSSGIKLYVDGLETVGNFETSGGIELRDAKGVSLGYINPPLVYDANGSGTPLVSYQVKVQGQELDFQIKVSGLFLLDMGTAYPVTVDPTISPYPPATDDATVMSACSQVKRPNDSAVGDRDCTPPVCGSPTWDCEGWLDLMIKWAHQPFSTLPACATIDAAYLWVYTDYDSGHDFAIYIDQNQGPWVDNKVTWDTAPGAGAPESWDIYYTGIGWNKINVTDTVGAWIGSTTLPEYGLRLWKLDEEADAYAFFQTTTSADKQPNLELVYSLECENGTTCCLDNGCFAPRGTECLDENYCTSNDACDGSGNCSLGTAMCDPAIDSCCDPAGCWVPSGTPCISGIPCMENSTCNGIHQCVGGHYQCEAGTTCCDPAGCWQPEGGSCDDANACTSGETCDKQHYCIGGSTQCPAGSTCCDQTGCWLPTGGACDDGNACSTSDTCDAAHKCDPGTYQCDPNSECCTASGCWIPQGGSCEDGSACTSGETCTADHLCVGGTQQCEPGSTCCDENGCWRAPGDECSGGNGCVTGELCNDQHKCVGGSHQCNPNSECCDASGCWLDTGAACDDGDVCTINDNCNSQHTCVGGDYHCRPGSTCCDENGCWLPTDSSCDDGNACTSGEKCDVSHGCTGGIFQCEAGTTCCGQDGCWLPSDSSCDDGNACTSGESCNADHVCTSGTLQCQPGSTCCDANGCWLPSDSSCDDGNACTSGETCNADHVCTSGTLQCQPGSTCCDGNGCWLPTDTACDDGNACTSAEKCDASHACTSGVFQCKAGTQCCGYDGCWLEAGTACNDADICTSGETCNADHVCNNGDHQCRPGSNCCDASGCWLPAGSACSDGDACTSGETCGDSHVCLGGTFQCDPATSCCGADGCFAPTGTACDDANACTSGETCSDTHVCTSGAFQCEPGTSCCGPDGCWAPADTPCSDASACTSGETCDSDHVCTGGTTQCEPGSTCCDLSGCFATSGTGCDDGVFCNGDDTCDGSGVCANHQFTGDQRCDDGDPCTIDTCNEAEMSCSNPTQCEPGAACCSAQGCFLSSETTCDDGNTCTSNDVCNGSGVCAGTPACDPSTDCCDPSGCFQTDGATCGGNGQCMDGDCVTTCACKIIKPVHGNHWMPDSRHKIKWVMYGPQCGDTVKIQYSVNDGKKWRKVKKHTANDGLQKWLVPDKPTRHARIRITDTNNNSYTCTSLTPFRIKPPPDTYDPGDDGCPAGQWCEPQSSSMLIDPPDGDDPADGDVAGEDDESRFGCAVTGKLAGSGDWSSLVILGLPAMVLFGWRAARRKTKKA